MKRYTVTAELAPGCSVDYKFETRDDAILFAFWTAPKFPACDWTVKLGEVVIGFWPHQSKEDLHA